MPYPRVDIFSGTGILLSTIPALVVFLYVRCRLDSRRSRAVQVPVTNTTLGDPDTTLLSVLLKANHLVGFGEEIVMKIAVIQARGWPV